MVLVVKHKVVGVIGGREAIGGYIGYIHAVRVGCRELDGLAVVVEMADGAE